MLTKTNEKSTGNSLFINTADEQTRVVIFSDGKAIAEKSWNGRFELSDRLLIEINQLVKKNTIEIDSIRVFPGPGSYTGLRIGVTVANFLAWSYRVPIFPADDSGNITSKQKDFILPIYLNDAQITKSRSKIKI